MVRRRPRIVPSDIKRQTRGFAESPFVVFKNLRARKMPHDFLIRGSGRVSFARYASRSGTANQVSHHRAHSKMRPLLATVVPMKSPYEGGVDQSLPSKVRGLLPLPSAQLPEKRTASF